MCYKFLHADWSRFFALDVSRLIAPDEPDGTVIERANGSAPMLLTADHAGNLVPRSLGQLGLPASELERHIGIDIGILGVSQEISRLLDATLIYQRYSRLVIDCNRHPQHPSAFASMSDHTEVPGNQNIAVADAARRITDIFMPYHAAISSWLDMRRAHVVPAALVAMHSFTPHHRALGGERPWPIAMLFHRDNAIATRLIDLLRENTSLQVGENQPYAASPETDFAIPVHGEARSVLVVGIEIRQDLIATPEAQKEWSALLAPLLNQAVNEVLDKRS